MTAALSAFLQDRRAVAHERARWPGGIHLDVTSYLGDALPPLALVTSVRGVVLRGDAVLALRKPNEDHILPGGRREPGESLEQTLRREVLEETGWTVATPRLIGCIHLRHSTSAPEGYAYPYPDFFHVVYMAEALTYQPESLIPDDIDGAAIVVPLAETASLALTEHERIFLLAAVAHRTAPRSGSSHPHHS